MNADFLRMKDVPKKYHIPDTKKGQYNRLVCICPECDNNMCETNFEFAIGFASVPPAVVMVVACDKCGERYYSHAGMTTWHLFRDTKKILASKAKRLLPSG